MTQTDKKPETEMRSVVQPASVPAATAPMPYSPMVMPPQTAYPNLAFNMAMQGNPAPIGYQYYMAQVPYQQPSIQTVEKTPLLQTGEEMVFECRRL